MRVVVPGVSVDASSLEEGPTLSSFLDISETMPINSESWLAEFEDAVRIADDRSAVLISTLVSALWILLVTTVDLSEDSHRNALSLSRIPADKLEILSSSSDIAALI